MNPALLKNNRRILIAGLNTHKINNKGRAG
jgi:hypothetical protein